MNSDTLRSRRPPPRMRLPYLVLATMLLLTALAAYYLRANAALSPSIIAGGLLLSLVFFVVMRSQARARREAEGAAADLRASESRFRTVIEQSPMSTQIFSPDGRTLRVNRAWEELWGVTLEGLGEYNILEDPQLEQKGIADYIRRGFAGEAVAIPPILYDPEQTVPGVTSHKDARRWVSAVIYPVKDEAGRVCEVVLMHQNITDRTRAESERRESEERFRTLAETASDGIINIDETSTILFINQGAEKIFGHAVADMLGQSLTMLMPDYLRHVHRAGLSNYLETGRRHITWDRIELPGLHKDGHEIPLELSFGEFIREGRHYFTGVVRDITDRRRVERERDEMLARERALRAEAEEANRFKDEFLATLSHELRTPLTSVLGWSKLLRTERLAPDVTARALEAIERNATAQTRLINDLLDVSRIVTGKLRLNVAPLALAPVIEAAVEGVRPAADARGVNLSVRLDPSTGYVSGDADRLQQVVWNFLSNAIKFTPRGGSVEVRLLRADGHAEVAVADTGRGIAQEFLPHVFERFRQADGAITREHGGLGLGLAIARHLVELHGGTVSAESEGEGRGATFRFRLPLLRSADFGLRIEEEKGRDTTAQSAIRNPHSAILSGLHVLVVDDDDDSRSLIATLLGAAGARVTGARSTAEGLELLKSSRPDVLVADIGMPGEDGYELMRKLRALAPEQGAHTPAAALTAYARPEDRAHALEVGYQLHIAKPVEPAALTEAVAHLAGRSV